MPQRLGFSKSLEWVAANVFNEPIDFQEYIKIFFCPLHKFLISALLKLHISHFLDRFLTRVSHSSPVNEIKFSPRSVSSIACSMRRRISSRLSSRLIRT